MQVADARLADETIKFSQLKITMTTGEVLTAPHGTLSIDSRRWRLTLDGPCIAKSKKSTITSESMVLFIPKDTE